MQQLERHPLSEIFAPYDLSGDAFKALVQSVHDNGVMNPITTYEGKVLDGWNRYRAAREAGVHCPEQPLNGDRQHAVDLVIGQNILRRHLEPGQRAAMAAKIANLPVGRPANKPAPVPVLNGKQNQSLIKAESPEPAIMQAEAAAKMDVSERSVRTAAKVQREGSEELAAAMDSGEVKPKTAAKVLNLPKDQQLAAAKAKKAKPTPKAPAPLPEPEAVEPGYIPEPDDIEAAAEAEAELLIYLSTIREAGDALAAAIEEGKRLIEENARLKMQVKVLVESRDEFQRSYGDATKRANALNNRLQRLQSGRAA